MSRLLTTLMILAGMMLPASAQEAAAPVPGAPAQPAEAAGGATPETEGAAEDEDDDAEQEDEPTGEGTYQAAGQFEYSFAGLLAAENRTDLAPLTLASGQPVAGQEYTIRSGGYYRMDITADGSAELALSGGDFFRAVWINEIVINDIEIRPMGVHSIEFDNAGTATISFVAVTPGRYALSIPGSSGETQRAVFNIQ